MLSIIGIGPGGKMRMTLEAIERIKNVDVIVGYGPYIDYVREFIENQEVFQNGMKGEIERCKKAIEFAKEGKEVAVISTGDAGLYGMAGPILELAQDENIDVEVLPGVSSAFSAAADLGAPLMMDTALISLSDLLVSYEKIKERVRAAAMSDFVISFYNPRSKGRTEYLKEAFEIIKEYRKENTPVGIVRNSGRENFSYEITTLGEIDFKKVDMKTIVLVGNSTSFISNGRIITKRGYDL
ncbi:MAG: precorrin-3B C(17)-methyltransferase [Ezakiella sp.]|nr:precorrin-3B C(17)-methyltransferase [Ezakiella sp.]MDD7471446.1 precorrin-3B C(17)-methyltransferase [Bacillota bacterium]MDY3922840.1 precorrin-3B C(17)-methyltransferase [Ezakiella sp.]